MTPCILMRASRYEIPELEIAKQHFPVYHLRSEVPAGSLVIGRYANLPFHRELEQDLKNLGSNMVNSSEQHNYVANFDYYEDLAGYTFPSWFNAADIPQRMRNGPFVVKGRTNSLKQEWSSKMFAKDFATANRIASELRCDSLIGPQGVVYREFVPLETFEDSPVNGMPFSNEWRIFYYNGRRLAHGFYWSLLEDWTQVEKARPDFESKGLEFADEVAQLLVGKVPFVVIDIAKTVEGKWVVVELNDGCMAGLNDSVPAEELYKNLRKAISEQ